MTTLHLHLDRATPADVTVQHLADRAIFTPQTIAGSRWLNTHCGHLHDRRGVVVSFSPADLEQRIRDAGLVVD